MADAATGPVVLDAPRWVSAAEGSVREPSSASLSFLHGVSAQGAVRTASISHRGSGRLARVVGGRLATRDRAIARHAAPRPLPVLDVSP